MKNIGLSISKASLGLIFLFAVEEAAQTSPVEAIRRGNTQEVVTAAREGAQNVIEISKRAPKSSSRSPAASKVPSKKSPKKKASSVGEPDGGPPTSSATFNFQDAQEVEDSDDSPRSSSRSSGFFSNFGQRSGHRSTPSGDSDINGEDRESSKDAWKNFKGGKYPNLDRLFDSAIRLSRGKFPRNMCYRAVKHMLYDAGCLPNQSLQSNDARRAINFLNNVNKFPGHFQKISVRSPEAAPPGAILVFAFAGKSCSTTMRHSKFAGHIEIKSPVGYHHFSTRSGAFGRQLCGAYMPLKCGTYGSKKGKR